MSVNAANCPSNCACTMRISSVILSAPLGDGRVGTSILPRGGAGNLAAEQPGVQVAKPHLITQKLVVGVPFMVAAAFCIALLNLPSIVAGLVLAGLGFDVLRTGD